MVPRCTRRLRRSEPDLSLSPLAEQVTPPHFYHDLGILGSPSQILLAGYIAKIWVPRVEVSIRVVDIIGRSVGSCYDCQQGRRICRYAVDGLGCRRLLVPLSWSIGSLVELATPAAFMTTLTKSLILNLSIWLHGLSA